MSDTYTWYQTLIKPAFAPPAWIFGPVWSVLYVLIIATYGYVFYRVLTRRWPLWVAVPFLLNIVANIAFTPIQFGLQNNLLAFVDILIVLSTLIWTIAVTWNRARWVALLQMPYLLWVSFATVLQGTITWLNR